ncbi:RNA polymerase sigma factor [bacterium]|nr:RNA polymerase sigma factor [bacterium]
MVLKSGISESVDIWDKGWPQTPEELGMLVDAFGDKLVLTAFRRVGNLSDAEDVVQEVFVRVYTERLKRSKILHVKPYLYTMVINMCTDLLRKRKRPESYFDSLSPDEISHNGSNPHEITVAREELFRIEKLLGRLPKAQADVVRLRVFEELRLSEIAEVVGCSLDTVNSRLRYGFRKLRKIVAKGNI